MQIFYARMNYGVKGQECHFFAVKPISPLPTSNCSAPGSFRAEKQTYNQPSDVSSPNPYFTR